MNSLAYVCTLEFIFVKSAKAFAPISLALYGAFSIPPVIDTCAPILLFLILIFSSISIFVIILSPRLKVYHICIEKKILLSL